MKLVDILARELKEWPCNLLDFAQQDYDKEIRFHSLDEEHSDGSHDFYIYERADDGCDESTVAGGGVEVTRAQWQAAVDALKAEAAPAWVGVGLPPVGTVCELKQQVLLAGAYDSKWFDEGDQVEVGGHARFSGAEGSVCTVCAAGQNYTGTIIHEVLRPIHTPEQIAADQYEEDAAEIAKILIDLKNADEIFVAKTLLDCGYRKFEIVDKDDGEEA